MPDQCIACEGTGIAPDLCFLCPECGGIGVYEQPLESIEGVYLTHHRPGCRFNELAAEGLNPHSALNLQRCQPGCECPDCGEDPAMSYDPADGDDVDQ